LESLPPVISHPKIIPDTANSCFPEATHSTTTRKTGHSRTPFNSKAGAKNTLIIFSDCTRHGQGMFKPINKKSINCTTGFFNNLRKISQNIKKNSFTPGIEGMRKRKNIERPDFEVQFISPFGAY
jgi:hypothetical protein